MFKTGEILYLAKGLVTYHDFCDNMNLGLKKCESLCKFLAVSSFYLHNHYKSMHLDTTVYLCN